MIKIVFRLERVIADTHYRFPGGNQSRQIHYKPRTANSALYDGGLLAWLSVSLVKSCCFLFKTCVQTPAQPTAPRVLPVLPGPSPGWGQPKLGDSPAFSPHHLRGAREPRKAIPCEAPGTGSWWVVFRSRKKTPTGQMLLS